MIGMDLRTMLAIAYATAATGRCTHRKSCEVTIDLHRDGQPASWKDHLDGGLAIHLTTHFCLGLSERRLHSHQRWNLWFSLPSPRSCPLARSRAWHCASAGVHPWTHLYIAHGMRSDSCCPLSTLHIRTGLSPTSRMSCRRRNRFEEMQNLVETAFR